MMCHNLFPHLAKLWLSQVDIFCSGADFSLSVNPSIAGMYTLFYIMKYSLNPSIAVPLVLCDSRALYRLDLNRLWALAHTVSLHVITFPPMLSFICAHPPSLLPPKSFILLPTHSLLLFSPLSFAMASSKDPASISSILLLTSVNYCLWADNMKSWLQLNGLWCLVLGQEKKPAAKPEIKDSKGAVVSKAVALDKDKLEKWEIKAE